MRSTLKLLSTGFLISTQMFAQFGNAITGVGYHPPEPIRIAPGQVVTLFVQGLNVNAAAFASPPLPTILSGVKVSVRDSVAGYVADWPILRVEPWPCDSSASRICGLTAVTIEVPTDLTHCEELPDGTCNLANPGQYTATISHNGTTGAQIEMAAHENSVHILSSCDSVLENRTPGCVPIITASDGKPKGFEVHPGDVITLWAVGLGATTPIIPTGQAAPAAAPLAFSAGLWLDSRLDVPPLLAGHGLNPSFVGLASGWVGLYQVNVRLPDKLPPDTPSCQGQNGSPAPNARLTLIAGSMDSVNICLEMPPAP